MNTEKNMSGIGFIDETICGFKPGKLYLFESRPAVGKTSLMLDIVLHNALSGNLVTFFSLESTAEDIYKRLELKSRLRESGKDPRELPINIFDDSIGIEDIRYTLKREENPGLVCIDYLQLIKPDGIQLSFDDEKIFETGQKADERIVSLLRSLAEELNVPVVVTSQLSNASENELKSGRAAHQSFSHIAEAAIYLFNREYEGCDWRKSAFSLAKKEKVIDVLVTSGENKTVEHGWLIFDGESVSLSDAQRL